MRDRYAEENRSTAFSVINRESDILRKKYVGWKLSWSFRKIHSRCSRWGMQSISLQMQPLPTLLLVVPAGDALLPMPVLDLLPKSTDFSTLLPPTFSLVPRLLCLSHHTSCKFGASASSLAPAQSRAQPHPSPPALRRRHLCQNLWALMQILLLIASVNLEGGAVGVHIGRPLRSSADTNIWRQGHRKSTNCLLTVLDCLVTICLGQLPLII